MGISSFGIMSWKEGTFMPFSVIPISLKELPSEASSPVLFGGIIEAKLSWLIY